LLRVPQWVIVDSPRGQKGPESDKSPRRCLMLFLYSPPSSF
jgi:hypothetical protein